MDGIQISTEAITALGVALGSVLGAVAHRIMSGGGSKEIFERLRSIEAKQAADEATLAHIKESVDRINGKLDRNGGRK